MKIITSLKIWLLMSIFVIIESCTYSSDQNQKSTTVPSAVTIADTLSISSNEDAIISILKMQLNDYLSAFTLGDIDKSIYYLYPDMFVWMKETASKYGESFDIEDAKGWFAESVEEMKKMKSQQGIEFSWSLEPIEKIYESENTIIFISVTSIIAKNGYDEIKMGDENICISTDGGKNWKFLSNAPESAPEILRMKFSEDIIRKISNRY